MKKIDLYLINYQVLLLAFTLFLEEAFYVNSSFTINAMLEGLKNLHDRSEDLIVTCVGEVVLRGGQLGMLIMDKNKLNFNKLHITSLLLSKNTLF